MATVNPSNVDKRSEEAEQFVRLCNYTDVYYEDEITGDLDLMEATASQEEIENYSLQERDVVVTKDSESWDDIAVPAFVPEALDRVLCGYHLAIVRPIEERASGRFLSYAFQAEAIAAQLRVEASGITRYGLTVRALQDAQFPVPPLRQQTLISDFLDQKTSKIDRLIAKKERLIELLEERRTALITKAVTKGLDPDVPMKDSGVDWLGKIPEHWDVPRMKYVAELHRGFDLPSDRRADGTVPVISSGGVIDSHDQSKVGGPGVITGRYGSVGNVFYTERDFWPLNTSLYVRDFRGNYPRFVYYLLQVLPILTHASKSAVPGVDRKDVHEERAPLPSNTEQRRIASALRDFDKALRTVSQRIESAKRTLREYRSALITAAVTGKIDVRDHAA